MRGCGTAANGPTEWALEACPVRSGSYREMTMPAMLDTRGMTCPLPILKAKRALKTILPGEVLTVLATDPGAQRDFVMLCNASGNTLVESSKDGDVFTFVIRKAD